MPERQRVDVARVKQLLAKGVAQHQIVKRLGLSKCTVSRIASGKYPEAVA
jgi:transcriptional regulator with XRE-family HTH domain